MKETAEAEMASMFKEVAADDAAMSEIRSVVAINIASNPVVTVKPAAIKIALTVKETSMPQIVAIMPSKLSAAQVASNPTLLIEERAALPRRAARHAAEVRWTRRAVRHPTRTAAAHTATHVGAHTAAAYAAATAAHTAAATVVTLRVSAAREDER